MGVRYLPRLTVSTVVPSFNRAHLLERALRSAVAECQPGDEVIVVDDGSTDNTEAVVRAFGSPVRYLSGEHRGSGAARNVGIRAASGDLVAFLDSDDEWISGKLSWQRAVLEQFPDILFLFSEFGHVTSTNERLPHQLSTWHSDVRSWDDILGPGIASATIAGMPASAPPFKLHVGRLYEGLINHFYICTSTFIVRREQAGDALQCAEDVEMFDEYETFARLANRGLAGFMDCDTEWNHGHRGARLTDADHATRGDILVKITTRVWGTDVAYLSLHRDEYEAAVDSRRLRKVRFLLGKGRREEARQELAQCFHPPWFIALLAYVPSGLLSLFAAVRRRLRFWRATGT
jgi:glycosyltransferase involved in cell wall biosynthesis